MTEMFLFLLLSPIESEEERQVLTELFEKHWKDVEAYVHRHFKLSKTDGEDCVQQSYLKVAQNIKKVVGLHPKHRVYYLLRAAYTTTLDFIKKSEQITFVDVEDSEDEVDNISYSSKQYPVPSAADVVENREVLRLFQERLSELSPTERVVFQLYFIEGMSREDLVKYLKISPNSIRTYISRAKTHAQKILKEIYYGE